MSETTNNYPVTAVLGFSDAVKQMLDTYKTQMTAAGVDPAALLTKLGASHTDLVTKNNKQEGLKTQLRTATAEVEDSKTTTYDDASRGCDMLISAFGKKSEIAQEAVNLRKSMRRQSRPAASTPPPAPTPA